MMIPERFGHFSTPETGERIAAAMGLTGSS